MDRQTAEHFYTWLDAHVHASEQHQVEQQIHALLADYPELVLDHGWTEMRELAERNYPQEAA